MIKESYEDLENQGIEFCSYGVSYKEDYHLLARVEKFLDLVEKGELIPDEQTVEAFFFSTLKRLSFIFSPYPKVLHALAQVENTVREYAIRIQDAADPKGLAERNLKALKDKPVFRPDPVMEEAESKDQNDPYKFTLEIIKP